MTKTKAKGKMKKGQTRFFSRRNAMIVFALLLISSFGLRMIDLTDAPLDFHPTRQYRGALIARSIYYQLSPVEDPQEQALAVANRNAVAELEPPILESIAAFGYLMAGGEALWIARIVNSIIWLLGAWAIFKVAEGFSSQTSAMMAAAYFLFLPFAVSASRSFQPDPLMVTLIVVTALAAIRWTEQKNWKWTILSGVSAGAAVLIKAVALYYVGGILIAVVLSQSNFRDALRSKQVWSMAAIAIILPSLYYLPHLSETGGSYVQNWVVRLLPIAFEGAFYIRWLYFLGDLFGLTILLLALSGVILSNGKYRAILVGLWVGYVIYGITLPHQTLTHNYYHLPLTLIVALSIAPLFEVLLVAIRQLDKKWQLAFAALVLSAIVVNAWTSRSNFLAEDHRNEIDYWESVGEALPTDGKTIGLVQHYGHLLYYYGKRNISLWPVTSEINLAALRGNNMDDFEGAFLDRASDEDYFLITTFNQLDQQKTLKDYLNAHFDIYQEGAGYLIYDMRVDLSEDF
jgi:4-amino-4-deoxy-L-arabinose transferase-like glycosyltransferase